MGSFKDVPVGNEIDKYLVKPEYDKTVIVKVVEDYIEQWAEVWPTFTGVDGNMIIRRFVGDTNLNNFAPINEFKKSVDLKKILNSNERYIGNWKTKTRYAQLVIVGIERKVKNGEGKTVRKIEWDKNVKIWQYGITVLRQLQAINRNPELVEQAESKLSDKGIKMADPDDMSEGTLAIDVYSLRVLKKKDKNQTMYEVNAGKLIGPIGASKVNDFDKVKKVLMDNIKPDSVASVEEFISSNYDGFSPSSEPESKEETLDEDAGVSEEIDIEGDDELGTDDKSSKKEDKKEDDSGIDDLDLDDLD